MKSLRLIVVTFFLVAYPFGLNAATMSIVTPSSTVTAGEVLTARVVVNPAGTAINNGEAVLRFPADILQVISVSKAGSIFSLWVEDPGFSNAAGTVSFNGGVPNPGVSTTGTALIVSFRATRVGVASLSLTEAAVRANDGLGTDVLTSASGSTISVTAAALPQPVVTPAVAPSSSTSPLEDLVSNLMSTTHPDENAWYQDPNPLLTWKLLSGVREVATIVGEERSVTPSVSYIPAINEKKIEGLADGIWYFRVRARSSQAWSTIKTYRIQVDTTPPALADPVFTYDEVQEEVHVSDIEATDTVSGIASYELHIDGTLIGTFKPEDVIKGTYAAAYPHLGHDSVWSWFGMIETASVGRGETHTASLVAIDYAGNHVRKEGTFTVLDAPEGKKSGTLLNLPISILIAVALALLMSLAALVLAWLAYRRFGATAAKRKKRVGKREQILHRSLMLFKADLERHIDNLDKAHAVRALTKEEKTIRKDLEGNIDDLERYLKTELKKLD